jgi:hypothetical protein
MLSLFFFHVTIPCVVHIHTAWCTRVPCFDLVNGLTPIKSVIDESYGFIKGEIP